MGGGGRRSCKSKVRIDQVTNIFSTIFALKPKQMLSNALQQLHRNLHIDYNWFPPLLSLHSELLLRGATFVLLSSMSVDGKCGFVRIVLVCVYCYSNLPIQVFNLYGAI